MDKDTAKICEKDDKKNSILVDAETISNDLGISKTMAYKIIKELNTQMKKENPNAIVITGKANRIWYNEALFRKE